MCPSGKTCYAFTGPVDLTAAECQYVADIVSRLEGAGEVRTGAAYGVDTVACFAALTAFESARHTVCVPAAPHNVGCVERALVLGAEALHVPAGSNVSASYMARNDALVDGADVLVGFPETLDEVLRSGTWATIRRARKRGVAVWLYALDGSGTSTQNGE